MELELDRDGPSNDERALRLEQERTRELGRELGLQQETINLDRGLEKVDALSDMSLQCLSETELDFIKREISEFAFIKTGSPANIQELEYDPDRNLVMARCNGRYLQIELDKEGFEKPIEIREKLGEVQSLEREHKLCVKNCGHLEDMAHIAIDQHNKNALMQEIKIEQASQGLMGMWNKLTGQIPEPYPSLYEQPLTHDDLARSLLIADVRTDHFQQLLENQLPEMQRYPQKIDELLGQVVEQSRDHLESVKLEAAAMVAGHELERNAKQQEIEPQLEKPIEERPIVDERQQDARQEDLNPTLNHDDRELTRQEKLELSQEKIDEIREIYVNRIHEVNQELSDINATRQVEGYWEQSHEITQADTDRADLLLSQRLNLYEILDRTPDEQQAYLDNHPEFDLVLSERDYDKVQVTLDDLSETMPKPITLENNPDDYKVDVWDSVTESVIDTAKTVDAFVEVAVADGLNTGTKIGMNVGAVTLGAYHGIKEGSLDEGITAMREIRDGAVDDYKIEASQSSQEILSNSENLQAVGTAIHEGMEYGYNKVGEHLGDEAQFFARGAMEAVGDTLAVTGAGLGARSIAKNLDYTVVNFKYAQLETSPNIAHHIRNFDGYDPKNGMKGTHNRESFTQALNDNNLQITKEVQGSKGISEVYYGREKVNGRGEPDGFKNFRDPKTIYDPKIYSDEQILQMGKKAVVLGYNEAIEKGLKAHNIKVDNMEFRFYINKKTKEVTNFHPTMKGE